jgi:hypothetical protein
MSHISDRLYNFVTYGFTVSGIAISFGDIKSFILFIGGIILLSLQIRLHLIKIKKEKENK